jgi:hypothetical protein
VPLQAALDAIWGQPPVLSNGKSPNDGVNPHAGYAVIDGSEQLVDHSGNASTQASRNESHGMVPKQQYVHSDGNLELNGRGESDHPALYIQVSRPYSSSCMRLFFFSFFFGVVVGLLLCFSPSFYIFCVSFFVSF